MMLSMLKRYKNDVIYVKTSMLKRYKNDVIYVKTL